MEVVADAHRKVGDDIMVRVSVTMGWLDAF